MYDEGLDDYWDHDEEDQALCELDLNGSVCLTRLRSDGTCPVHDPAPHKIILDVQDGTLTARLGLTLVEGDR